MKGAAELRRLARGPVRRAVRQVQAERSLLRPGRRPGPPDFVGIGAQRSGTSWWHGLIEAHPAVAPLGFGAKELHFFDDLWAAPFTAEDGDRYHAHFLRRPGQIVGEWTPRYLFDPWAVPMLVQAAPDARLLVMLRDPVTRFVSGLGHARKHHGRVAADDVAESFARGLYAPQLRRVLDLVPRSRVQVLQFERCLRKPAALLGETFDFLGLPATDCKVTATPVNAAPAVFTAPASLVNEVRERYAGDIADTHELFPDAIDLDLWTGPAR